MTILNTMKCDECHREVEVFLVNGWHVVKAIESPWGQSDCAPVEHHFCTIACIAAYYTKRAGGANTAPQERGTEWLLVNG